MIPRLHVGQNLERPGRLALDREAGHYLTRVLRLGPGAAVVLFDGRGGEWDGLIEAVGSRAAVTLTGFRERSLESPLRITLVQGLAKSPAMDLVVQKGVELGVAAIIPLLANRSVSRPNPKQTRNKESRWAKVAIEAAEQCGRTRIPALHPPTSWKRLAPLLPDGPRLLFWESLGGPTRPSALPPPPPGAPLTLLIGPEGGLEANEVDFARDELGFIPVGLGPRILRTETAALAALTWAQTLWGDMG